MFGLDRGSSFRKSNMGNTVFVWEGVQECFEMAMFLEERHGCKNIGLLSFCCKYVVGSATSMA